MTNQSTPAREGIAIIGMQGRFPGAPTVDQLWANLTAGVESISELETDQLRQAGVPESTWSAPRYVRAKGLLDGVEEFDASFFGVLPADAAVMDPQHRLFLECAWAALEQSGHDPGSYEGLIAVFGGAYMDTYLLANICSRPSALAQLVQSIQVGTLQTELGNDKDYLATRVSYKLGLRGPSMTVQTACSTSLVAIAQACQSLMAHQCDMALAGGVTITVPQARGYLYQEDGMLSPDGHCRPFDAKAQGTVFSNGLGVIVLKRLTDALADGDDVIAVIRGWALNNDGGSKLSYTAPSVDGQADVIAMAHAMADVEARSISYIEAHGTATPLGDPIEIAALTKAFRLTTDDTQFCAVGSIKSNIGHLDVASGVTGVIKAALCLRHRTLVPTLHYTSPNPKIDFGASPFYVNQSLRSWDDAPLPRRAGVSSFGVGGTNAHIILEEAPPLPAVPATRAAQVLLVSARTPTALDAATTALAQRLDAPTAPALADVAYTLQNGRRSFSHRRAIVASSREDAVAALRASLQTPAAIVSQREQPIVFMFPGQGAQNPGMGRSLYATEPVFRQEVDRCAELLEPELGLDLRSLLYASEPDAEAARVIRQTVLAQPSIFVTSYALARLWMSWGVIPSALIGHSVGELAAACLAGVIALPDALRLLSARGRLMQAVEPGAMLSVRLPADDAMAIVGANVDLAASNSPQVSVVAGTIDAIAEVELELSRRGIGCRRLDTSHAFHSRMMNGVVPAFAEIASRIAFSPPSIPIVSTVTGQWLTDEDACRPSYWSEHVRKTVRFADAVTTLGADRLLLEVGPGQTLATMARQTLGRDATITFSLGHADSGQDDSAAMQGALGRLWTHGIAVDWPAVHAEPRRRVPLPTYPFERRRFWIEPDAATFAAVAPGVVAKQPDRPNERPPAEPAPAALQGGAESGREALGADQLTSRLRSVLTELSGMDGADLHDSTSLLDLGFDSLLLTQVSAACQREFGVKVTMRQLLAEMPTIDRLSAFLRANTAVASAPVAPVAAAATPRTPIEQSVPPPIAVPGFKPPDRAVSTLTDVQRRHLDQLIERYTTRTATSKRMTERYRPVLADPRTVSGFNRAWKEMVYPIVVTRSAGARLWDVDGNEYIDLLNGFGPNFLGHSPSFVIDALKAQLDCGIEVGPQTPLAGEVAQLISEMTGMERVSFVNTGSEAVQAAMRVARTVTGRDRVVVFAKDYHGNFDEVLVRGQIVNGQPRSMPIAPGIPARAVADIVVLDYGSDDALEYIRRHGDQLAAVLIEPIQSRRPEFQPREFLHQVRQLTEQSGTVMVMDEVITGFRLGPGGAQEYYGVRADLATYGKVVGGGMPIGVVAGRADLMDTFDGGQWSYGDDSFPEKGVTFFAGTFVRHPLAMAAARASLQFLKAQPRDLWDGVHRRTARLANSVSAMLAEHAIPIELPHFGSQMFVRVRDDAKLANLVFFHLRARGVFLAEGFPTYLTIAHQDAEIDTVIEAWRHSLEAMQDGGFFNRSHRVSAPVEPEAVPLTAAQQEIWLAVQMNPAGATAFNECTTIRLNGPLDRELLRDACREVVARHDALAATIDPDGQHLRIAGPLAFAMPLIDLTAAPDAAYALHRLTEAEATTPFDLVNGPLVRGTLVVLPGNEHVVLLSAHHIVCDGWSFNLLIEELSEAYSAKRRGGRVDRPPYPSFADFARAESRRVGSPEDAAVERYWRNLYQDPPAPLDLPTDATRPAIRTGQGATTRRKIHRPLADRIRMLARRQGCTLFSTLFAAYQVLLHRLSGQRDFCVGIPVASQVEPEHHGLVGYAVNFLPLRATLSPAQSFAALLQQVRAQVIDGLAHQPYTYGRLLPLLSLPRQAGRLPLVEVEFNLERMDRYEEFEGVTSTFEAVSKRAVNFDLFLNIVDTDDGFLLECDHATALFSPATIERWLASYEMLLESAADDANTTIGRLEILSPGERRQLLVRFNDTVAEFPSDATVHGLVMSQCDRTPNATAVIDGARQYTYRQLEARASSISRDLRAAGTLPGDLVAVAVDPGIDMLASMLAVMKCGAAYVPIDPAHPAARIDGMLRSAQPRLVITADWLASRPVNDDAAEPAPHCRVDVLPTDRAYVIHTSGTTGIPKGVEIEHRSVVNLLWSMRAAFEVRASDRLLAITTPTFDIAALELFLPLVSGATVVLTRREVTRDGIQLAEQLRSDAITLMQATPSTWRMLLDAGWRGDPRLQILCGGEALPTDLAERLVGRGRTVWNLYGPTETTIWSSMTRVTAGAPVTLGRPIANTQMYVLDADGTPVPTGVLGQLHIAGAGLARGYLNDPSLTGARFVEHPLNANGRLYATGDLVCHTAAGTLHFAGRLDDQVKVRGHRVELAEIELALAAHPAVAAAAATTELINGDRRIVAGVVARGGTVIVDELRPFIEERLPAYMWPSRIGVLQHLPLTASNKIDRRRLLELIPGVQPQRVPVAARDRTERVLAEIWSEVLRIETVSIFDDVFDLGADSLSVFQLSARARQASLAVSPNDILAQRTIAKIAASISSPAAAALTAPPELAVCLAEGPEAPPLFLVHGAVGEILSYRPLAKALSRHRAVFGFPARFASAAEVPSVERIAERYVAALRRQQPHGPYHLGGFCGGGVIAFEMARQLQAANEPVGVIALLDVELEQQPTPAIRAVVRCLQNVPRWFTDSARVHGWRHLAGQVRSHSRRLGRWLFNSGSTKSLGALRDDLGLWHLSEDESQLFEAIHAAIEAYRPQQYHGRVCMFRPRTRPLFDGSLPAPGFGWSRYVTSVDDVVVRGSHSTLMSVTFANDLASRIEAKLASADNEHAGRQTRSAPRPVPTTPVAVGDAQLIVT